VSKFSALKTSIRLLIVAEHASTRYGGEALIAFQYFRHLRQRNIDVHLLVHERTRAELCEAFPNDIERLHFVTDSFINIWCHKIEAYLPDQLALFMVRAVSQFDTQVRQRRAAKALVDQHRFNIIHQPIPVSPRQPSTIFGLSVPVIIGPMNGGMAYPPNYDLAGPFERTVVSVLRWMSVFWNTVVPGKRYAALLLVANKRTYEALPWNVKSKKILELVENGVDLDCFRVASVATRNQEVVIIYVGRLVGYKRVDLLLHACGKLIGKINFQLHIVGDGPLRGVLERQVNQLSLTSHVQFHGMIPQAAVAEKLRSSDIMAFPSMRECGGAVVLEAMASGIPVIATKWGGPADYLAENTGILIPPGQPEEFITEFATAILMMAKNPEARAKIGQAARLRAQALYNWHVKTDALLNLYENVVSTNMKNFQGSGRSLPWTL
jgi:glycosyltransferase involved in cell wall biosynthesis